MLPRTCSCVDSKKKNEKKEGIEIFGEKRREPLPLPISISTETEKKLIPRSPTKTEEAFPLPLDTPFPPTKTDGPSLSPYEGRQSLRRRRRTLSQKVIAERYASSDLPEMEKKKYLVPRDMSIGQFIHIISSRLRLSPGKALFVFVNNTSPQTATLLDSLYGAVRALQGQSVVETSWSGTVSPSCCLGAGAVYRKCSRISVKQGMLAWCCGLGRSAASQGAVRRIHAVLLYDGYGSNTSASQCPISGW